ncbi:hypothetical protein ACXU4B_11060 [Dyella soli]|uniref:Secreted protein n=1 Tax=Dyella soli TaxID=522319 RepID=A0A4R0YR10_9GAMM|nr:hypothetical protein [Dyella soli]TCI07291.1 hypothetical protein EZM97_32360 [Dyella soli]
MKIVECRSLLFVLTCTLSGGALAVDAPIKKLSIPQTEAACVARGGQWIFAGPQNVTKYCLLHTTDGGKVCKSSNECQSECVETEQGNQCAGTFTGCFAPTGRGTVTECVN